MAQNKARRWFISGRVQGVGFRYFVQKRALELALHGYAKNLDDGRVEVYATGTEDKLSDLAAALHTGPIGADVRGVEQKEDAPGEATGFRVT